MRLAAGSRSGWGEGAPWSPAPQGGWAARRGGPACQLPLELGVGVRATLHWILPSVETLKRREAARAPDPRTALPPGPALPTHPWASSHSAGAPPPPTSNPAQGRCRGHQLPHAHLPDPLLTLTGPWAGGQSWDLTLGTPLRAASPFLSLELGLGPASQQPGVLVLRLGPGGVPRVGLPSPTGLNWPLLGAIQPGVSTLAKGQPGCVEAQHPTCRAQGGPG